ncbi:MAG: hypothetical protein JWM95_1133 [Gemmatimonadetes bacterium]|nr:hypothetical protein [Gemmatimonadota bacterium]
MSEDAAAESPRDGLMAHLAQLEAFVEKSAADGEEIPPEAAEMIVRLREIMHALDGLASSMGDATSEAP